MITKIAYEKTIYEEIREELYSQSYERVLDVCEGAEDARYEIL